MTIGFIGTGNMGSALMQAFSAQKKGTLVAYNRGREKLLAVCQSAGALPLNSSLEVANASDVLILAVKPQVMPEVLQQLKGKLSPELLVITIAAGLELSFYQSYLGQNCKLTRTIPNTPAKIQAGITPMCFSEAMTAQEQATVQELFRAAGAVEVIPEKLMDAASALTGCSPAYVYLFLEAMADAAVLSGIPRIQAYRMAAQAVLGSASLMLQTGEHPGVLKDAVCSPGGTTIRGVAVLEETGFRSSVIQALTAAVNAGKNLK